MTTRQIYTVIKNIMEVMHMVIPWVLTAPNNRDESGKRFLCVRESIKLRLREHPGILSCFYSVF